MNVLEYSSAEQSMWTRLMLEMGGYQTKTTFYGDLSIAEFCEGVKGIRDTYNRVMKEWMSNVEYITEFIMCLNHKIWEFYDENYCNRLIKLSIDKDKALELSRLYDELWKDAEDKFFTYYKEDVKAMEYYYQTTD